MDVQLQWSLNQSSKDFYNIARGVLQAATSDNVQPLAILACERFGNTLAMNPETCKKVEKVVIPTPKPAPVQFLRGAIGFSSDDCATQLGKSLAGVQFLALAAALITSMGVWEASEAVEAMLRQTATDKTLLPNTQQIRDLLARLEPRCHAINFADSVTGWHSLLCRPSIYRGFFMPMPGSFTAPDLIVPGPQSIEKLIDAFRQIGRIGEDTAIGVTIAATKDTAWLVAFTKWCLGVPPSVYTTGGIAIIEEASSPVKIITDLSSGDTKEEFKVTIHHSLGALQEIIVVEQKSMWTGMVSVSSYRTWQLLKRNIDKEKLRIMKHAVPYATSCVLANICFSRPLDPHPLHTQTSRIPERHLLPLRLSPFPNSRIMSRALSLILDAEEADHLPTFSEGLLVRDLPLVNEYLRTLSDTCSCDKCKPGSFLNMGCLKGRFFSDVELFVADSLALSLFYDPETLQLDVTRPNIRIEEYEFLGTVKNIIHDGTPGRCDITSLMKWVLGLIGHHFVKDFHFNEWVMSSSRGQVVYPTIFDTNEIEKSGYLMITRARGVLQYQGQSWTRVLSSTGRIRPHDLLESKGLQDVTCPVNLMSDFKRNWRVTSYDGFLEVHMVLESPTHEEAEVVTKHIWGNLAEAYLVEECAHDSMVPLDKADRFCRYSSPLKTRVGEKVEGMRVVGVVAVDGADDLRLLALSDIDFWNQASLLEPFIIRKRACLACCLRMCRRLESYVLLL